MVIVLIVDGDVVSLDCGTTGSDHQTSYHLVFAGNEDMPLYGW